MKLDFKHTCHLLKQVLSQHDTSKSIHNLHRQQSRTIIYTAFFDEKLLMLRDKKSGVVKIVHDISRERFVEKMKSEFITIAGHQLRTPLSAIKGALNLLKSGDYGPITAEQKQSIGKKLCL
jgi:signal transduction histidine kinase